MPLPEPMSLTSMSSLGKRLFFADSDDEDLKDLVLEPVQAPPPISGDEDLSDVNVDTDFDDRKPPSSAASNMSSVPASPRSSPAPVNDAVKSPVKKPRLSSPGRSRTQTFTSAYIGTFIVGNAWSTAKGRGYVKPGDEIKVERDEVMRKVSKSAPAKGTKAKKTDTPFRKNGVQLSLATMMKAPPPKASKKAVDSVVRLINMRGFGCSRILISPVLH
jgi:DNA repair protein RAD5